MIGSIARVPSFVTSGRITQDTVKLVFRDDPAPEDISYIHWVLRTPQYRAYCAGHAMGSAVVALSRSDFLKYPIPPASSATRVAVSLLDSIDNKIELNRRIAATLEEMGRTLFKNWFIDFNPVRAKAEGRPSGLPEVTAALFPDRLGEDGLPEGWSATADSIGLNIRQQILPTEVEPETPYVGLEHVERRKLALETVGRAEDVESHKAVFKRRDLLFGKLRPYFHKVAIAPVDGICSTDILVFRPQDGIPPAYLYFAFSADGFVAKASGAQEGTRMPRADWGFMRKQPMARPTPRVLAEFDNVVGPLIERILVAIEQIRTLTSIRDTLLLNLISGELRVKNPRNAVEAA
ncbi:restriction endonuclease subunit S [Rhizobium sp. BK251]|uniref:restriction endonuclease subunit S n=1 Tax=Rhizobium sp. BK251 TaxID=2512125 RepID=UPI00104929CE|nr:restriction endonuclease subunit S [Rhizobium sp. BK251]